MALRRSVGWDWRRAIEGEDWSRPSCLHKVPKSAESLLKCSCFAVRGTCNQPRM